MTENNDQSGARTVQVVQRGSAGDLEEVVAICADEKAAEHVYEAETLDMRANSPEWVRVVEMEVVGGDE